MSTHTPKRVWITGGSEGLSLALATQLLEKGCEVALSSRVLPNHQQLIEQYPKQLLLLDYNLSDASLAAQAQQALLQRWSAIDLLIINAGSGDYLSEQQAKQSLFESLIESNIYASAHCLNYAARLLKEGQQPQAVAIVSPYTSLQLHEASQPQTSLNSLSHLFGEARQTLKELGIDLTLIAAQTLKNPITPAISLPQVWSADEAALAILERLEQRPTELVLDAQAPQQLWPMPQ